MFIALFLGGLVGCGETKDRKSMVNMVPPKLSDSLARLMPGARIAQAEDLDAESCMQPQPSACIVRADINGDGLDDYGMVVIIGKPIYRKAKARGAERHRFADISILVYKGRADGFTLLLRKDYRNARAIAYPLSLQLAIQPSGRMREAESAESVRVVEIKHPGILMNWCEQAAIVYYWQDTNGKMEEFWLAN